MRNVQFSSWLKNPRVLLSLILAVFFFKGVFLAALFPMFKGQDESRHYNTIQFLAEPQEKNWEIVERKAAKDKDHLESYNFSEEIKNTIVAAQLNVAREENYAKALFSENYFGPNEEEILAHKWEPYNKIYPPEKTGGNGINLYHRLASWLEKALGEQNILVRFYALRIFSVLLGGLVLLLSYSVAKNLGFSEKISLLLVALIAFQPRFSIYMMNINYASLLILFFTTFTLGGVLSLKQGLNWKNGSLLVLSVFFGFFTKGTAVVLLGPLVFLFGFHFYLKLWSKKINYRHFALIFLLFFALLAVFSLKLDLAQILPLEKISSPVETFRSFGDYFTKTSSVFSVAKNYWGEIGWGRENLSNYFIGAVWLLEAFALIGLLLFFWKKEKFDFLPEKKYLWFFLLMLLALQLGVRLYDWKMFVVKNAIVLGTPGRYFLPNLLPHLLLVAIGLGAWLRREKYLENALVGFLIWLVIFSLYQIFDLILPRFYL